MKNVTKCFIICFGVSSLIYPGIFDNEVLKDNLSFSAQEVKELRAFATNRYKYFCSENPNIPGCPQLKAFIEKLDELQEDGVVEAKEFFDPLADLVMVVAADIKNSLATERASEMRVVVEDSEEEDGDCEEDAGNDG